MRRLDLRHDLWANAWDQRREWVESHMPTEGIGSRPDGAASEAANRPLLLRIPRKPLGWMANLTVASLDREQLDRTLQEAEGYLELGMTEHALTALQKRGKLVHGSGRGCYLLGETLRELSRYREALFPLRRSATLLPDDVHVWLALGWCYKRTGQLHEAIHSLERALDYEPGEAILHYNLACYWALEGDRSHALDHLTRALHIDGNYRDLVYDEPDFDLLRDDPGFQLLTSVIA